MHPQAILSFGDGAVEIYMYGLMIALGILGCFWVLFTYSKLRGVPNSYVDFIFYNGICSIIIGFLGSAVWQGIYNYIDDMKKYGEAVFSLNGGITAMGGLISGAACFILICILFRKRFPFSLTRMLGIAPCCMTFAHAFGRLGCFFAGCCYGGEATGFFSFLGVSFAPGSPAHKEFGATPIYPTQLFEAIFLFALFAVMSFLLLKKNFRYNMVVYLVAYGFWRFFIEFLRADYRGSFIGGLSPSQGMSIGIVIIAVPAFFIFRELFRRYDLKYGIKTAEVKAEQTEEISGESAE